MQRVPKLIGVLKETPGMSVVSVVKTNYTVDNGSIVEFRRAIVDLLVTLKSTGRDGHDFDREVIQRCECILEQTAPQIVSPGKDAPIPTLDGVARGQAGLAPWRVRLMRSYLAAHLDSKITIQELASMARLSPFYFARAFKTSFGDSPHRYLLRQRMEHSQHLMLKTSASLSDIALDCGLVDQAHFGRMFRRHVGETPGAWRRARTNGGQLTP